MPVPYGFLLLWASTPCRPASKEKPYSTFRFLRKMQGVWPSGRDLEPKPMSVPLMVLCLLTPSEIAELELHWLQAVRVPIEDRQCPQDKVRLERALRQAKHVLRQGGSVYVHCRAGIGRAAPVTACLLCRLGVPAGRVWTCLEKARGLTVPDIDEVLEFRSLGCSSQHTICYSNSQIFYCRDQNQKARRNRLPGWGSTRDSNPGPLRCEPRLAAGSGFVRRFYVGEYLGKAYGIE